jgi:hypothetical protein
MRAIKFIIWILIILAIGSFIIGIHLWQITNRNKLQMYPLLKKRLTLVQRMYAIPIGQNLPVNCR